MLQLRFMCAITGTPDQTKSSAQCVWLAHARARKHTHFPISMYFTYGVRYVYLCVHTCRFVHQVACQNAGKRTPPTRSLTRELVRSLACSVCLRTDGRYRKPKIRRQTHQTRSTHSKRERIDALTSLPVGTGGSGGTPRDARYTRRRLQSPIM